MTRRPPARGHRAVPHTSDVILEAWGPDLAACYEEAVAALLGTFLDVDRARVVDGRTVDADVTAAEAGLLALLDEVLFVLDTSDLVPVAAHVEASVPGVVRARLDCADRESVEATGAAPKAIARSELRIDLEPAQVRCTFLVDV